MDILKKGTQIGPYIIRRAVPGGVGGMATVYEAQLGHQGHVVALKIAHKGMGDFLKDEGAFLKARQLSHPNIIKILPTPLLDGSHEYIVKDAGTGCWYFAMEYLEGGDLDKWMQIRKRFSLGETLNITSQIARALDAAHQAGVLHLDVKPSNILFRKDPRSNGNSEAVLTDFGIARPEGRIASGQTLTVEYASPEQARRAQGEPLIVGRGADLYSLAVIFYEMLSGKLPFQAQNDAALMHHIVYESPDWNIEASPGLVYVLQRALAKKPEDRYETAQAFVEAVREQIPAEALQVPSPVVTSANSKRLSPLWTLLIGVVIGLGLGVPSGYYYGQEQLRLTETATVPAVPTMVSQPTPTLVNQIISAETDVPPTELITPAAETEETEVTREPTSTPKPTSTPTPTYIPRPTVTSTPSPDR